MHAGSVFFSGIALLADPWHYRDGTWRELFRANALEGLSSLQPCLQVVASAVGEYRWEDGGVNVHSIAYIAVYAVVLALLMRRRHRMKRNPYPEPKVLLTLTTYTLPIVTLSTSLSLSYLLFESTGCLLQFNDEPLTCKDIVYSNNAFAMVFSVIAFVRLWVIPFSPSVYTTDRIVRFDFSLNEMLQFLSFTIGGMIAVFLFASATEIPISEMDSFVKNKASLRNLLRFLSFGLLSFSIASSFLPKRLSDSTFGLTLKGALSTRLPNQLARVYRALFAFFSIVIVVSLDVPLLILAFNYPYDDNREQASFWYRNARQVSMVAQLGWPLLLLFNASFFLSRPKGSSTREKLLYLTFTFHSMALGVGNYVLERFDVAAKHTVIGPFFLAFLPLILWTRRHFASHSDAQISKHLHAYFTRVLSTLPPLIFLFAEGAGCTLRYNRNGCSSLIDSNLTVSLHISLGVIFYTLFAFTQQDITLQNMSSLRHTSFHTILQIVLIAVSSCLSFLVFGMRPDIQYVSSVYDEFGSTKATKMFQEFNEYVESIQIIICVVWAICYVIQGMEVRSDYKADLQIGEETVTVPLLLKHWRTLNTFCTRQIIRIIGTSDELKIAKLYRLSLIIIIGVPLGLQMGYVYTGDNLYEWASATHYELMLLGIIIYMFSSFGESRHVDKFRFFEVFLCCIPGIILLMGATTKIFAPGHNSINSAFEQNYGIISDIVRFVLISGSMYIVYRAKTLASSVLSYDDKKALVHHKGFMIGFVGAFPPVLYVGAELSGCMLRNTLLDGLDENNVKQNCGGLFPGAKAVTMHIVVLYFVSVSFAPLEASSFTLEKIMKLLLTPYQRVQLLLFFTSSMLALILYGTRYDGEQGLWQWVLLYSFYLSWFVNLCLEGAKEYRGRLMSRWTDSLWNSEGFRKSRPKSFWTKMEEELAEEEKKGQSSFAGVSMTKEKHIQESDSHTPPSQLSSVEAFDESGTNIVEKKKRPDKASDGWRVLMFANKSQSGRDVKAKRKNFLARKKNSIKSGWGMSTSSGLNSGENHSSSFGLSNMDGIKERDRASKKSLKFLSFEEREGGDDDDDVEIKAKGGRTGGVTLHGSGGGGLMGSAGGDHAMGMFEPGYL